MSPTSPTPDHPTETNANLVADLLDNLLHEASRIAADAHDLLAPMGLSRDDLRRILLDNGMIVPIGAPNPTPLSIAAVDGGSVREPLYVADLMVIVATSAEGMTSAGGHPLLQSHWCEIVTHASENDRILSAAMAAHELTLIDRLTHDLRLLDGSTTSPIITLSAGLNTRSHTAQDIIVSLLTDEVLQAIYGLGDPRHRNNPGRIVALPKSDSSEYFMREYRTLGADMPGGDRFMAAQVLERGEMLYPRFGEEHARLSGFVAKDAPDHIAVAAANLEDAVVPIRDAARDHRLVVTYLKPETADTVIKAEFMVNEPLASLKAPDHHGTAMDEARLIARHLSDETAGPHMQEPFAQYAVDLAAKTVSVGAEALNQAMLTHLPDGAETYLPLLVRSYRTKASTGPQRPGANTGMPGNPR